MKPIEIDLFILYDNLGGYHMYLYPLLRIRGCIHIHTLYLVLLPDIAHCL
ncbi:MAG: hypothetical protein LBS20_03370 [Prevotella sp.]|jgi:hypothetical protein|nr:hypothetical protein [Prevotella sp.]